MSRYNLDKINFEGEEEKSPISPTQGKSFLELLLHESAGEDFPYEAEDGFAELAVPNKNERKKRLKFLRFGKLKEMLDNLSHAEPEKPDGYVIMQDDASLKNSELEAIQEEAVNRDDTEEFLNSIEDKLKYFGKIGRKLNQSGKSAALAEDEAAFEAGIIRSITQDENIVSETLADLLVQQGQTLKAIKMYQALCLKFPEKSLFFAKKIKGLQ